MTLTPSRVSAPRWEWKQNAKSKKRRIKIIILNIFLERERTGISRDCCNVIITFSFISFHSVFIISLLADFDSPPFMIFLPLPASFFETFGRTNFNLFYKKIFNNFLRLIAGADILKFQWFSSIFQEFLKIQMSRLDIDFPFLAICHETLGGSHKARALKNLSDAKHTHTGFQMWSREQQNVNFLLFRY